MAQKESFKTIARQMENATEDHTKNHLSSVLCISYERLKSKDHLYDHILQLSKYQEAPGRIVPPWGTLLCHRTGAYMCQRIVEIYGGNPEPMLMW